MDKNRSVLLERAARAYLARLEGEERGRRDILSGGVRVRCEKPHPAGVCEPSALTAPLVKRTGLGYVQPASANRQSPTPREPTRAPLPGVTILFTKASFLLAPRRPSHVA